MRVDATLLRSCATLLRVGATPASFLRNTVAHRRNTCFVPAQHCCASAQHCCVPAQHCCASAQRLLRSGATLLCVGATLLRSCATLLRIGATPASFRRNTVAFLRSTATRATRWVSHIPTRRSHCNTVCPTATPRWSRWGNRSAALSPGLFVVGRPRNHSLLHPVGDWLPPECRILIGDIQRSASCLVKVETWCSEPLVAGSDDRGLRVTRGVSARRRASQVSPVLGTGSGRCQWYAAAQAAATSPHRVDMSGPLWRPPSRPPDSPRPLHPAPSAIRTNLTAQ